MREQNLSEGLTAVKQECMIDVTVDITKNATVYTEATGNYSYDTVDTMHYAVNGE